MKKMMITAVFLILASMLSSCATFLNHGGAGEVPPTSFTTPTDINQWIWNNISYKSNPKFIEDTQTPAETLQKRSGNCVDMSTLFIYFVHQSNLGDAKYVYCTVDGHNHVIVKLSWFGYYDPTYNISFMSPPNNYRLGEIYP
jgi:predicted small secreted protein